MSIAETGKIDIVATKPGSDVVRLIISDHLDWDDVLSHVQLLQDKINTYITFVESGQLKRMKDHDIPASPDIHIILSALHEPPEEARGYLFRFQEALSGLGLGFDLEVKPGHV